MCTPKMRRIVVSAGCLIPVAVLASWLAPSEAKGPYFATGIKICEVDTTSAIIWTRLTRSAARRGKDRPLPVVKYKDPQTGAISENRRGRPDMDPVVEFPQGSTIDTIEGAVPGAPGDVRVRYQSTGAASWQSTAWQPVDPNRDFTAHFPLRGLKPATGYQLLVESRSGSTVRGKFRTAPVPHQPARVVFTVVTGTAYPHQDAPEGGYKIYAQMLKLDPSFFVHTGDILYYDALAKTQALARWHWHSMYSLPTNVEFHRQAASYFIKDDHDTWMNDCWPEMQSRFMGDFTFKQGQAIFLEQVGMGPKTMRTFRWGKDLQVWLPEGRDFRSPNDMPDGPRKTIWGKEQKDWFQRSVLASDATFRVLISPTPLVGPDRVNKGDNHANKQFAHEGNELRSFIASQKNMYVVTGDRHWQYVSEDSKTGLREFSCGPASDIHAGGFRMDQRQPEHRYLNIVGGFLAGTVERVDGKPVLTFRHYSVDGRILNEDRLPAKLR
jgi:alkaline phosphatase D